MPTFLDFDLTIQKAGPASYLATAQGPVWGRAGPEAIDYVALTRPDFGEALRRIRDDPGSCNADLHRGVGEALFGAVFTGQVLRLFTGLYDQRVEPDRDAYLRLRLDIDERAPEIAALPWEFLYWKGGHLATQLRTLVSRQLLNLDYGSIEPLAISGMPRVLVVIPTGSGLDTDTEERIIAGILSGAGIPCKTLKGRVTLQRLNEELATYAPHILHFVGHGTFAESPDSPPLSALRFNQPGREEDPPGEEWVEHTRLETLLLNYRELKLVFLNTCQGAAVSSRQVERSGRGFVGMAPAILRAGVPAVIAMQYAIGEDVAIRFADTFYRRLTAGEWAGYVDIAVTLARHACLLDHANDPGFATPVLYLRAPDGRIFDLSRESPHRSGGAPADDAHTARDGLTALAALASEAHASGVRAAAAAFQTDFQASREQIASLERDKRLHDLYHQLQDRYRLVDADRRRLATDATGWDSLAVDSPELDAILADLLDMAAGDAALSAEIWWPAQVRQARQDLATASEDGGHESGAATAVAPAIPAVPATAGTPSPCLEAALLRLSRLLSREPSRVNTRLVTTAGALRLSAIVAAESAAIEALLADLPSQANRGWHDLVVVAVQALRASGQALTRLEGQLKGLVSRHNAWQAVADELRRIEDNLGSDAGELALAWPDLKAMAAPLCGEGDDEWAAAFAVTAGQMEAALAAGDLVKGRRLFPRYRSQADRRFNQVDRDLLALCGELQQIGAPLDLLLRAL